MALVRCDYFSDVLEMGTSMTVLLPQATSAQIGVSGSTPQTGGRRHGAPVLYLLHGLSDDATAWTRYTSIERYVEPLGLAVVMPQVARSFYLDQAHGGRYWEHLSQEVPAVAESFFRLSARRDDTFVAGLSMGGYGAMKWALHQPERFAAAASLSGALDLARRQASGALRPDLADAAVGDRQVAGSDDDLLALLERQVAASHDLPALYVGCGTDDELVSESRSFLDAADRLGVPVTRELDRGAHDWAFWDERIQHVLDWLPLER
ncbi:alpha/beta hydrolase family protein [Angustibacter sp. Root456]|uniref:alpha/beta hydrolase n=1 Tax=Angustibacter sp. Root456 TaxID=1736539 RepID=UPI0006F8060B|nr:alpha/beta hydrolase family protein [Angustibacter sp. Root456]KQX68601.1 esterase [Angustibacter sp. Root456]